MTTQDPAVATGSAPAAATRADWHGRLPDQHRYECRTCDAIMSTNVPAVELAEMWRTFHAGHDTSEAHDGRHIEPCSGIAATWCPNCGDCSCPVVVDAAGVYEVQNDDAHADPRCPLHGLISAHG